MWVTVEGFGTLDDRTYDRQGDPVVRHFPRITRRRVAAVLALGSVFGSVLVGASMPLAQASDHGLRHKRHQVSQHISLATQGVDESSAAYRRASAALHQARTRLGTAQAHLSRTRGELAGARVLDTQMQGRLDAAVTRLRHARAELADGRAKIAGEQRTLGQIVVDSYQTSSPGLLGLSMVLTSQNPAELTGQLNSVQSVLDKQTAVLDRLEASKVLLTVQEHTVAKAKAQVARQRRAAAANLVRKQSLESEAEAATAQVAGLVKARAHARESAARARAADLAELARLQREKDRLQALLRARAAAAAAAAGAGSSSSVASNGYLSWPVAGAVTSPFGWRTHPIFGYRSLHDGIDIAAACGTPIHAPASGTVLEEYFQTAWGNRIVLDLGLHSGVGLAGIVNHMSRYAVSAGAHVTRGQVIGYIGTTGWSTGCHTHFTVMANGSPVDPLRWL